MGFLDGYKAIVGSTRGSPGRFLAYSCVLLGAFWVTGELVIQRTNPGYEREGAEVKNEEFSKLPLDQRALAEVNKAKLVAMLRDIQDGKDDGSRYTLAMQGKVVKHEEVMEKKLRYGVNPSDSASS